MIDSALKRRSAATSRRLPWQRRFGRAPTGSIDATARVQQTLLYAGITIAESAVGSIVVGSVVMRPALTLGVVDVEPFLSVGSTDSTSAISVGQTAIGNP